jgi:AhpD family alkylhydroperoxidase
MASLDAVMTESIGIAAAVAGHCRPCLEYHLAEARGLGVSDDQIREAVKLAEAISRSGDRRMHEFAQKAIKGAGDPEESE